MPEKSQQPVPAQTVISMLRSRIIGLALLLVLKGCTAGTGEPEYNIQQKEFTLKIVEAPILEIQALRAGVAATVKSILKNILSA